MAIYTLDPHMYLVAIRMFRTSSLHGSGGNPPRFVSSANQLKRSISRDFSFVQRDLLENPHLTTYLQAVVLHSFFF